MGDVDVNTCSGAVKSFPPPPELRNTNVDITYSIEVINRSAAFVEENNGW